MLDLYTSPLVTYCMFSLYYIDGNIYLFDYAWCLLTVFIIHSKYFPNSDWLKANV